MKCVTTKTKFTGYYLRTPHDLGRDDRQETSAGVASQRWSSVGPSLSTETVEGSALSLESVDDVERGDGLSLGVLGVGDRVSDDVLEAGGSVGLVDRVGVMRDVSSV